MDPVYGMIAIECVKIQWILYGNKRQNGKVFENTNEQNPFCKWSIKKTQLRWCPYGAVFLILFKNESENIIY